MANAGLYSKILENNFRAHLVIPELAEELGLDESIVLQQIHYWITKSGKLINNEFWIYNTFENWKKQFKYWSISKIKRIFYSLEGKGYIHSKKMNVKKSNHTKWYTIDYDKLVNLIGECIPEKKFTPIKTELSLCQSDTIINSNTYNNSAYINNLSNEKILLRTNQPSKKETSAKIKTEVLKFEEEICEEMIKIWNEVFIYQKYKIVVTKNRAAKLLNLWNKYFHNDIQEWKFYCISINSSKFLMGEKKSDFKARFDWLISESVVNRVLLREFDIGDRIPDIESQALKIKAEEQRKLREQQKAELKAKRVLEDEKNRVELLAEKLAHEELQKLESSWGEEDKVEIKNSFESYMGQEVIEDEFFASFKDSFRSCGWATVAINYLFEQFKIKFCLKKSFEDFLIEAQILVKQYI